MPMPVVSTISSCSYPSYASQAWQVIHYIPWIVPLAISFTSFGNDQAGRWGKQLILTLYGFWLYVNQIVLKMLQEYFARIMPDPYCTDIYSYAFPSLQAFYIASVITYGIMFAYLWNISIHWFWWTVIFLFFVGPQSMLMWMLYNTWQESLVSTLLGVISTTVFLLLIRFKVQSLFPYLVQQFPFTYLSAIDTEVMTKEQQLEAKLIRERMEKLRDFV